MNIRGFLYKLRFLPILLGIFSLGMSFVLKLWLETGNIAIFYSIGLIIVGIIFLQAMRQLQMEAQDEPAIPKNQSLNMPDGSQIDITFKEPRRITISGFDGESPEIISYREGETLLMLALFPPEDQVLAKLVTQNFTNDLAAFIGAEVKHEDRELFRINSSDPVVINKIKDFFSQ